MWRNFNSPMAEFSDPKHLAVKQAPAQRNAAANWGMPQFAGADGPPELNPGFEARDTSKSALDSSLDKQYQPNALLTNPKGGKYAESKENPALVEALVALEPRPPGFKYKTSFPGLLTDKPLEMGVKEATPVPPVQSNGSPVLGADGLAIPVTEEKEGEKETLDKAGEKNTTSGAPDAPAGDPTQVAVAVTPVVADVQEVKAEEKVEPGPEKLDPAPELSATGEGLGAGNPLEGLGKGGGKAKRKAPVLNSSSSAAVVESVASQSGLDMVRALEQSGKAMEGAGKSMRKAIGSALPVMDAPTGLPAKLGGAKKGNAKLGPGKKTSKAKPKGNAPKVIDVQHKVPEQKGFWEQLSQPSKGWRAPAKADKAKADVVGQLNGLIHSNATPQVDTRIGARPKVPLVGAADPAHAKAEKAQARLDTQAEVRRQNALAGQDFGEADIFPTTRARRLRHTHNMAPARGHKYANRPLVEVDPAHEGILGADADKLLKQETARSALEAKKLEAAHGQERELHISSGETLVDAEESATSQRQVARKKKTASQVAGIKQEWQKGNEGVLEGLDKQADAEWRKLDVDVGTLSADTEVAVDKVMTAAETEAADRRKKAEAKVAARREEAKKKEEEKGWFDWAVDKVKGFFAELKAFVSQVFDDLRAWVKQKFEAAKKWVADKIEQARKAITGMISWFGDKLKGFVDVAFAAFPNIRDKFKSKIDSAVDATTKFVDEQAAALTQFAQDTLDKMATAVDSSLGFMEDATLGLLDGLEMVAVATIKAAEYFYNLLLDKILKLATLAGFAALIAGGFLVSWMWPYLGDESRDYLIDLLFDTGIWLFEHAPDDMHFGVLWPLFVHLMLGFLYEADETDAVQKRAIMTKIADILTFRDGDFVWNFVLNIFVGIFENIWGIITGIYDLILFVTRDVWVIIGQVADWLEKVGPEVADALEALGLDLKTTMEEFRKEGPEKQEALLSSKNINQLLEFLNGLGDSLRVEAEVMGATLAGKMREFMLSGMASAEIGKLLGNLTGQLIVEIVLAVFTVGAGTAIKAGLRVVAWLGEFAGWLSKFGKTAKALARVAEFFSKGLKWLVHAFETIAAKWDKLSDAFAAKFKAIFAKFGERIEAIIAKLMGKADEVPGGKTDEVADAVNKADLNDDLPNNKLDDTQDFHPKQDADGVVDTDNVDPEDAKNRKSKDNEADDLVWAAAEAKMMLAAMEAAGIDPITAAESTYAALRAHYKWIKNVQADPDGLEWDIFIIASKHKVYEFFKSLHGKSLNRLKERAKEQGWEFNDELRTGKGWVFKDENGIERIRYRQTKTGKYMHENDGYVRWANEKGQCLDMNGKAITTQTGKTIPWDAGKSEIERLCGGVESEIDRVMAALHININNFVP